MAAAGGRAGAGSACGGPVRPGPRLPAADASGGRLARYGCGRGAPRVHPTGTLADGRSMLGRGRPCGRGCDGIRRHRSTAVPRPPWAPRTRGHDVSLCWAGATRAHPRGTVVVPTARIGTTALPHAAAVPPSHTGRPLWRLRPLCRRTQAGQRDASPARRPEPAVRRHQGGRLARQHRARRLAVEAVRLRVHHHCDSCSARQEESVRGGPPEARCRHRRPRYHLAPGRAPSRTTRALMR